MRDIQTLSTIEIEEILNSVPAIFIGSAISSFHPTSLPSGEQFCRQLFEYVFQKDNLGIGIPENIKLEIANVPFEAIMECCPTKTRLPAILNKIYGTNIYNAFHYIFSQLLLEGKISSIITPNYDLAIDNVINEEKKICTIKSQDDYLAFKKTPIKGTYFKIHGTSEINCEDTLIYTLSQEGSLEKWKQELLTDLLQHKILIVIGYSGRDFDICPLIAEINYKKVIWIKYVNTNIEQSAYEEYLLASNGNNLSVAGDFKSLLLKVFNKKVDCSFQPKEIDFNVIFSLSLEERLEWRINILSRIACANIGMKVLNNAKIHLRPDYVFMVLSEMYGHTGEYYKAALNADLYSQYSPANSIESLLGISRCSQFWINSGKYFKAYRLLNSLKLKKNKLFPNESQLDATILGNELTFWQRMKQLISNRLIKYVFILFHKYIDRKIEKLQIRFLLLKDNGNWNERQLIQHNIERLQLKVNYNLSLPAIKGYRNLGLTGMEIIACRHSLSNNKCWDDSERKLLEYCISKAKELGMNTELWKLLRLKFQRENLSKHTKRIIWLRWKVLLQTTEYAYPFNIFAKADLLYHYYFKV